MSDDQKNICYHRCRTSRFTCAYQLASKGMMVEIFEAANALSGMAKTIPLWGQLVDLGPHRFFSNDPRVNKM